MTVRTFLLQRYAPLRELDPKSVQSYLLTISRWAEYLGREPELSDFTNDAVALFLQHRATTPRGARIPSARTVQREAKSICSIWTFAAKRRERPDMEFPILKRRKPPEKIVTAYSATDIQRLLTACAGRRGIIDGKPATWWWATLIYTMFLCGTRITETLLVRWRDIDMHAGRIRFCAETRKGKTRDIERDIRPELVEMLRGHVGAEDDLVWNWHPRHRGSIYPSMKTLCKRAGVVYRKFHGLRKSSASFVQLSGGDATSHLDHSSPAITKEFYLAPSIVGRSSVVGLLPQMTLPPLDLAEEAEFVPDPEERS